MSVHKHILSFSIKFPTFSNIIHHSSCQLIFFNCSLFYCAISSHFIINIYFSAFSTLQDQTFGRRSSGVRVSPLRLFIARHWGVQTGGNIGREAIASSFAASRTLLWFGNLRSRCLYGCSPFGRWGIRGNRVIMTFVWYKHFFKIKNFMLFEKN